MRLCAEKENIPAHKTINFGDYFSLVPKLEFKSQMGNLNNKRVSLKHNGSLPSNLDIEISRANTTDFFEINTRKIFETEFSEISLISFIQFERVKEYLIIAEKEIQTKNFEKSISNSQNAFLELLTCYEEDKKQNLKSPFEISENMSFKSSLSLNLGLGRKFDEYIVSVNKSLSNIDEAIKIIGLGIDYKKYIKFKLLSPYTHCWQEDVRKYESHPSNGILLNHKNSLFCFDFVINSALKLQELDFDISELMEVNRDISTR